MVEADRLAKLRAGWELVWWEEWKYLPGLIYLLDPTTSSLSQRTTIPPRPPRPQLWPRAFFWNKSLYFGIKNNSKNGIRSAIKICLFWILRHINHVFNYFLPFNNVATTTNHLLVGLQSKALHGASPGNIWFLISVALGHIVIIFFFDVPDATPTIFICRTIRVNQWWRQMGWDISRSNTEILNRRLFWLYYNFHFIIDMSKITVKNEIRRQGWLKNRGIINPWLFQWSSKFLFDIVLSIITVKTDIRRHGWTENRGDPNPRIFENLHFSPESNYIQAVWGKVLAYFFVSVATKSLDILYRPEIILELLICDITCWPNFLIQSSSMD